jgi:sterol desaturase/sphingolipid hydroxylase (fatty acid hydroxylase superfamily)
MWSVSIGLAAALMTGWAFMIALEDTIPNRKYPALRGWKLVGFCGCLLFVADVFLPLLLPEALFEKTRIIDGRKYSLAANSAVAILTYTFLSYWWHRACHHFDFLWRVIHQMHHAPERLDVPSATFFHPFDLLSYTVIFVSLGLLGATPAAMVITTFYATFNSLFQHLNVKTPRWLGYFFQRPESHGHHHEVRVHRNNYSDLPWWYIIFGTFNNPETYEGEVGFGKPWPVVPMLLSIDISSVGSGRGPRLETSATSTAGE